MLSIPRQCRIQKGWTIHDLADRADTSKASIMHFELGQKIRPNTALLIAEALNMPLHILAKVEEPNHLIARWPLSIAETPRIGR